MSNNSDLLKRLSSPENAFNKHYAAYMGECTANKSVDKAEMATENTTQIKKKQKNLFLVS